MPYWFDPTALRICETGAFRIDDVTSLRSISSKAIGLALPPPLSPPMTLAWIQGSVKARSSLLSADSLTHCVRMSDPRLEATQAGRQCGCFAHRLGLCVPGASRRGCVPDDAAANAVSVRLCASSSVWYSCSIASAVASVGGRNLEPLSSLSAVAFYLPPQPLFGNCQFLCQCRSSLHASFLAASLSPDLQWLASIIAPGVLFPPELAVF